MQFTRGLFFAILALALSGLTYGLFLPSLERYIVVSKNSSPPGLESSVTIFSLIVAMYSVGECIGAFIFSRLYIRCSMKTLWIISFSTGIIGNFLYIIPNLTSMFISRIICGIWTGGMSNLARSYVGDTVPSKDQTQTLSLLLSISTFCFAGSPSFAGLFTLWNIKIIPSLSIYMDEYTSPAWFLVILCIGALLLTIFFCKDHQTPEQRRKSPDEENSKTLPIFASNWIVCAALWLTFCAAIGFSIVETMVTPIMADKWGTSLGQSSIIFLIAGFMLFFTAITLKFLTKPVERLNNRPILSDRVATFLSFLFLLFGSILMSDFQTILYSDPCRQYDNNYAACIIKESCVWNPIQSGQDCPSCGEICWSQDRIMNIYQFVIGFCFSNIGFQIARIAIGAMIIKITPKEKIPMITSLLVIAQALSRIVAPLFAIQLYQIHDTSFPLMTLIGIIYISSIGIHVICYKKLDRSYYSEDKRPLINN